MNKQEVVVTEDPLLMRERILELERNVLDLTNRCYYLEQECETLVAPYRPKQLNPGKIYIGMREALHPGDHAVPVEIPFTTLQRSAVLLGNQGSGKSNFGKLMIPQVRKAGVRVVLLDYSGEYRSLFRREDVIEADEMHFNPFDDVHGLWSDRDISAFVKYVLFSVNSAGPRGTTNLGRIGKLVHHYLEEVKTGRHLSNFLVYLGQNAERFGFPPQTTSSLAGFLEGIIYDGAQGDFLNVKTSTPSLLNAIRGNGDACIQVGQLPEKVRPLVVNILLRQLAARMQREFHEKGSSVQRPLSTIVLVEEAMDIVADKMASEWFEAQLRTARKTGLGYVIFARDQSTLKDLDIGNLMTEAGIIAFFRNNQSISTRNPPLQRIVDQFMFGLQPGECILYCDNQTRLVKTEHAEEGRYERTTPA